MIVVVAIGKNEMLCKICGNSHNNTQYTVREMMYGFRDEFKYILCGSCGCLQIAETPSDISKYYPTNYYSYQYVPVLKDNPVKSAFKKTRTLASFSRPSFLKKLFLKIYTPPEYFDWLKKANVSIDEKILDVGCGIGHLLIRMQKDGFSNLTGVDPFLPRPIQYDNGINIFNVALAELKGRYDFIMSHHSFEHIYEQFGALVTMHGLLKKGKTLLVRVPVSSSYAWRVYKENWVNLDAPRHFFLHTEKSMRILAEQAGFQIIKVEYDSTDFQFWGSEQYRRNIPLRSKNSHAENSKRSIFSCKKLKEYRKRALKLNQAGDGDEACFYLYKP